MHKERRITGDIYYSRIVTVRQAKPDFTRRESFLRETCTALVELGFFSFVHVYEERHYEDNEGNQQQRSQFHR